jgi:UPF0716 protein FxsA
MSPMALLVLFVVFIVAPLVELYVIVQVAQSIGVLETIAALIVISAIGAWLVKAAGLSVLVRIQQQMAAGRVPTNELVDGGILLFAGALMLAPGFLSDVLGILLILPPTRAVVRRILLRSYRARVAKGGGAATWGGSRWFRGGVVVDADSFEDDDWRPPSPPRGELDG